jgi:methionine synthase II (cobalamin-independent)
MLQGWANDSSNPCSSDEILEKYIQIYNNFLPDLPSDMHIGVHICRGNGISSKEFSEGGYDAIAKLLFQKLNVHTYYLEYDTPKAGSFEPLQHLPKSKNVVLGVVSTKIPALEDEQVMIRKVKEAAHWMARGTGHTTEEEEEEAHWMSKGTTKAEAEALQRCSVSPQCGFASHMEGNPVTWDDMVAKLKLLRTVADKLWPGQP